MNIAEINKVLEKCTVTDLSVFVPLTNKLELRNSVFDSLESIGGVWQGGKSMEFKFKEDPTLLLKNIASNDEVEVKENRFDSSPELLAAKLVSLAKIDKGDMVAEPSAGRGNIVKAIVKAHKDKIVHCYELLLANQKFLNKISNVAFVRADFLASSFPWEKFDKIIAFPPIEDEVYHIREMYQRLEIDGTIVTVCSKEFQSSKESRYVAFKDWLEDLDAKILDITPEELSEIGVTEPFVVLIIKK